MRDLFPDNTIPMRYLDPVALKIESYIPLPSGPLANQLINNYAVPVFGRDVDWDARKFFTTSGCRPHTRCRRTEGRCPSPPD